MFRWDEPLRRWFVFFFEINISEKLEKVVLERKLRLWSSSRLTERANVGHSGSFLVACCLGYEPNNSLGNSPSILEEMKCEIGVAGRDAVNPASDSFHSSWKPTTKVILVAERCQQMQS